MIASLAGRLQRVGLALVLVLVPVACSGGSAADLEPPADDVVLRVTVGGQVAADWTLPDLESEVPFVEETIDGDVQTGPLLLDVIEATGVGDWESAEVLGMSEGRVVAVSLEISAATVNESWILDLSKRGTFKLASPALPREKWVRDVGEISFP